MMRVVGIAIATLVAGVSANAPLAQSHANALVTAHMIKLPGEGFTLSATPAAGVTPWLCGSSCTHFYADGITVTKGTAASNTITAPTTPGDYYVYVANSAGSSPASANKITVQGGDYQLLSHSQGMSINLSQAPATGTTAWIARASLSGAAGWDTLSSAASTDADGTMITKLVGDDTKTTIMLPKRAGAYKLYTTGVPQTSGVANLSAAATAGVTVQGVVTNLSGLDTTTNITTNQTNINAAKSNQDETLTTAPARGYRVCIASASLTVALTANVTTITCMDGDGSATTIKAPITPGSYKLYVKHIATGREQELTNSSVTVLPIGFTSAITNAVEGAAVTFTNANKPITGDEVYLAPANTPCSELTQANATLWVTMTRVAGNTGSPPAAITAPLRNNFNESVYSSVYYKASSGECAANSTQTVKNTEAAGLLDSLTVTGNTQAVTNAGANVTIGGWTAATTHRVFIAPKNYQYLIQAGSANANCGASGAAHALCTSIDGATPVPTAIPMPTTEGEYHVYVQTKADGKQSIFAASAGTAAVITVYKANNAATAPHVGSATATVAANAAVSLTATNCGSPSVADGDLYLALASTPVATLVQSSTYTTSVTKVAGNAASQTPASIQAPVRYVGGEATQVYKQFLLTPTGCSSAATCTLTVPAVALNDVTLSAPGWSSPPAISTVADQTAGGDVTLSTGCGNTYDCYLAPEGSVEKPTKLDSTNCGSTGVTANACTLLTGTGDTPTTMKAPNTPGVYKFWVKLKASPFTEVMYANSVTVVHKENAILSAAAVSGGAALITPGATVTLDLAPKTGTTVWLAPNGTTVLNDSADNMTKLVGSCNTPTANAACTTDSARQIVAPTTTGTYELFVTKTGSTTGSSALESTKTVVVSALLNNPNEVTCDGIATQINAQAALQNVPLQANQRPGAGFEAYLALTGVEALSRAQVLALLTSANASAGYPISYVAGSGTAPQNITAPKRMGTYKLIYKKTATGNFTADATTVAVTQPATSATLGSTQSATPGQAKTTIVTVELAAGTTVYIAAAGTLQAPTILNDSNCGVTHATCTKLVGGSGTGTSINVPQTAGTYKVWVVNATTEEEKSVTITVSTVGTPTIPDGNDTLSPGKNITGLTAAGDTTPTKTYWMVPSAWSLNGWVFASDARCAALKAAGNSQTSAGVACSAQSTVCANAGTCVACDGGCHYNVNVSPKVCENVVLGTHIQKTASTSATTIAAPTMTGAYQFYFKDAYGNCSVAATNDATVVAPTQANCNGVLGSSGFATVAPGSTVTLTAASGTDANPRTAWLAPDGTTAFVENVGTITKGSQNAQTIVAPTKPGPYKLFLRDSQNNVASSSNTLTVIAPAVDSSTAASSPAPGANLDINAPGANTYGFLAKTAVYTDATGPLAANGLTITDGAANATKITAPTKKGTYKVFKRDAYGNFNQSGSSNSITVEIAGNPDTALSASQGTGQPGRTITLNAAPPSGVTAFLAPTGTTAANLVANEQTITSIVGDGALTAIAAPKKVGTYYLIYTDVHGNERQGANTVTCERPTGLTVVSSSSLPADGAPGAEVDLALAPIAGEQVCIAPAGTVSPETNTASGYVSCKSGTGSSTTCSGTLCKINLPTVSGPSGTYRVFNRKTATGLSEEFTDDVVVKKPDASTALTSTPANPTAGAASIELDNAPPSGTTAWLVCQETTLTPGTSMCYNGVNVSTPTFAQLDTNNANMTKLVGDGTEKTLPLPTKIGTYKVFYADTHGNVSDGTGSLASTEIVTIIAATGSATANSLSTAGTVLAANITQVFGGNTFNLSANPQANVFAWLAPTGQKDFTAANAATVTKAASAASNVMVAPTQKGTYYVYLQDSHGNVSAASSNTVTVGGIPDVGEAGNTVDGTVGFTCVNAYTGTNEANKCGTGLAGATYTLPAAPATGLKAYLAPANTVFTAATEANATTITSMTGNGSTKTITLPTTAGDYKLFYTAATNPSTFSATTGSVGHVRVTGPTNQSLAFAGNQEVAAGAAVTLGSAPGAEVTPWFARHSTEFEASCIGTGMTAVSSTNFTAAACSTVTEAAKCTGACTWRTAANAHTAWLEGSCSGTNSHASSTLRCDAQTTQVTCTGGITQATHPNYASGALAPVAVSGCTWTASTPFVAAAATCTKAAAANGTSLTAPTKAGLYKAYLRDASNNRSAASDAFLVVTAPRQDQFLALASDKSARSGLLRLDGSSSVGANNKPWLAAHTTTTFAVNSASMTSAGKGATEIRLPTGAGAYKLYVADAYDNYSSASTYSVAVDTTAPALAKVNAMLTASLTVANAGDNMTFAKGPAHADAGGANHTAFVAKAGFTNDYVVATMRQRVDCTTSHGFCNVQMSADITGSGTNVTAASPLNAGVYHLYLVDPAGNISPASTNTITVTNGKPQNQNTVFPNATASLFVGNPGSVTIVPPCAATDGCTQQVWLCTPGASNFTEAAATCTKALGTATTITAPTTEGTYHIYVKHTTVATLYSSQSTRSVIVDSTAPTSGNLTTALSANVSVNGGASVTIAQVDPVATATKSPVTAWLAPASTTCANLIHNNSTITKAVQGATTIRAPTNVLTTGYFLYLKDAAGNCSTYASDGPKVTVATGKGAPTNQNAVLTADKYVKEWASGAILTFPITAPAANYNLWVAAATESISASTTANGTTLVEKLAATAATATGMEAPKNAGTYALFTEATTGSIGSLPSTAKIYVDGTAPPAQLANNLLPNAVTVQVGRTMKLEVPADRTAATSSDWNTAFGTPASTNASTGVTTAAVAATESARLLSIHTAWIAPSGTAATALTAGAAITSVDVTQGDTQITITAPTTACATCKLFVMDKAGNVSAASTASIAVVADTKEITGNFAFSLDLPTAESQALGGVPITNDAQLNGTSAGAIAIRAGVRLGVANTYNVTVGEVTNLVLAMTTRRRLLRESSERRQLTARNLTATYAVTAAAATIDAQIATAKTASDFATGLQSAQASNASFANVTATPVSSSSVTSASAATVVSETAPAAAATTTEEDDDSVVAIVILLLFIFVILPITICVVCTYCVAQAATEASAKGEKEGEDAEAEENEEDAPAVQV